VHESVDNLFPLGGLGYLVQFVEIKNRVHAFGTCDTLHDAARLGTFIGVRVAMQKAGVKGTPKANEGEWSIHNRRETILHESGLTVAWGSVECQRPKSHHGILNPMVELLKYSLFRSLVPVNDTI
jgi:hypothetical protein